MPSGDVEHALVSFAAARARNQVVARDELTDRTLAVGVSDPPVLERAPTGTFVFPVDNAAAVTTTELRIPPVSSVYLRDQSGEHRGEFSTTPRTLPRATYYLEIEAAVMAYVRIPRTAVTAVYDGPVGDGGSLRVSFDERTQVEIGARSRHDRPQATITVPDDPEALMDALPFLASSHKEFSPERSWPSLRGHPPAIEVGDSLNVPDELTVPESGVRITVPPTYADVLRVAPLAYYLGATIEPGETAALHTDDGYTERLRTETRSLEDGVDRVLATCLVLDSLVRVGGYYSVPRYEYDELAAHLPFYPPNLYDAPLAERLLEYLEVSPRTLSPHVPTWPLAAVLEPRIEDAELLPYLMDGLARVHVDDDTPRELSASTFDDAQLTGHTVDPPAGAAHLVTEAFRNASAAARTSQSDDRLLVATTADRAPVVETAVQGSAVDPDALDVLVDPPRAALEREISGTVSVFHVDLPASSDGVECSDGTLALSALAAVPVCVLRGDGAREAALTLADSGSLANLAAVDGLGADATRQFLDALWMGCDVGRAAAYTPALDDTVRVVGCPTSQPISSGVGQRPLFVRASARGADEYDVTVRTPASRADRLGGIVRHIHDATRDEYSLHGASVEQPAAFDADTLAALIDDEDCVLELDGALLGPNPAVTPADLREAVRTRTQESE